MKRWLYKIFFRPIGFTAWKCGECLVFTEATPIYTDGNAWCPHCGTSIFYKGNY